MLTGRYDHTGDTLVRGDTDSCILHEVSKKEDMELNMDSAIVCMILTWTQVRRHIPQFMKDDFGCTLDKGAIIKAGREVVGRAPVCLLLRKDMQLCV